MGCALQCGQAQQPTTPVFLDNPEGLYDLEQDPHEVNDLSGSPEHQEIFDYDEKAIAENSLPCRSRFLSEPYLLEHAIKNP